ncbi:hypothetical protein J2X97_000328 [Epilithonimonas hungarica]|uniref:hypothetical protein n=1 Tax=Epilithonimonas hungarica TaxID=454006 RepID=UPI00277E96CB|nr:hypothetical protein [Epilithonimonas hungarica]MDP9954691.1 hypothetical protein [Epilithonimonas hungarica]
MAKFKFSVTNGYYQKGQTIEMHIDTAKAFQAMKVGVIVTEEESPKTSKKAKTESKKSK